MYGRFRGARAGGPNVCVCPACGYSEPHQRGIPCNEHTCPKCGSRMTRSM